MASFNYSFYFYLMNTVDRILEFINSQDNESITQNDNVEPITQNDNNEPITQNENVIMEHDTKPINESVQNAGINEPTPSTPSNYKQIMRQLNKLNKQQEFPCIAKIDGKNKVFNDAVELSDMLSQMKQSHKMQLKEMKRQQIDSYKHFDEEYERRDEDIEDDGLIYKRGDIVAVKKADKVYKAPRTNKKDRQRIYDSIKGNKKLLTDLTLSKDEKQFETISSDNLRNEELNIYHKHRDNTINKDSTWTRASFLSMMNKFINDSMDEQHNTPPIKTQSKMPMSQTVQTAPLSLRQQYVSQQATQAVNSKSAYGLNPMLFGHQ